MMFFKNVHLGDSKPFFLCVVSLLSCLGDCLIGQPMVPFSDSLKVMLVDITFQGSFLNGSFFTMLQLNGWYPDFTSFDWLKACVYPEFRGVAAGCLKLVRVAHHKVSHHFLFFPGQSNLCISFHVILTPSRFQGQISFLITLLFSSSSKILNASSFWRFCGIEYNYSDRKFFKYCCVLCINICQ